MGSRDTKTSDKNCTEKSYSGKNFLWVLVTYKEVFLPLKGEKNEKGRGGRGISRGGKMLCLMKTLFSRGKS